MNRRFAPARIASIVAGHGEVASVPRLIGRVARAVAPELKVACPTPIRTAQYGFVQNAAERARCFDQARGRAGATGAILVLIDSEGDPPCQLGPVLLRHVSQLSGPCPVGLVLAHQEFEVWFLGGITGIAGHYGLPDDLPPPANPEAIRNAKGWLTSHMPRGRKYSPREHQAPFTSLFDLEQARMLGSFDKCYREIERLVRAVCQA